MDLNRLTQKSQEAVQEAQSMGVRLGHQEIDVPHLLLALLQQDSGMVPRILERMDVFVDSLARSVEEVLSKRPRVSGSGLEVGKVYVTQSLQRVLVKAEDEAKRAQRRLCVSRTPCPVAALGRKRTGRPGHLWSRFKQVSSGNGRDTREPACDFDPP